MKNNKADRELNERIGKCIPNILESHAPSGLKSAAQNIVDGKIVKDTWNKHQAKIQDMAEKLRVEIKNCIKDMETSLGNKSADKRSAEWHMFNWGFTSDFDGVGVHAKHQAALDIKEFFSKK